MILSDENFADKLRGDFRLQAKKLDAAANKFGIPDITALAKKYNQPVH